MDWNIQAAPWIAKEVPIELAHLPVRDELMNRAALQPGEAMVDIGCGSGGLSLVAADQVGATGTVIAFDIANAFVERARARAAGLPQVTAIQGDAQSHDFSGLDCDAVVSLFGMMFFPDPTVAFANIAQALKLGGRIHFVTWAGPEHNPWFSVPGRAMAGAMPEMPKPDPAAPGPMAFANAAMVADLMAGAGFDHIASEAVDLHLTPPGTSEEISAMMLAVGPARGLIKTFGAPNDEDRLLSTIGAAVAEGYSAFQTKDGIRVPARVIFYSGQRAA